MKKEWNGKGKRQQNCQIPRQTDTLPFLTMSFLFDSLSLPLSFSPPTPRFCYVFKNKPNTPPPHSTFFNLIIIKTKVLKKCCWYGMLSFDNNCCLIATFPWKNDNYFESKWQLLLIGKWNQHYSNFSFDTSSSNLSHVRWYICITIFNIKS